MVIRFRFIFTFSILLLSLSQCFSQTDSTTTYQQEQTEKIKQFHADILIKENGNLIVTETIKVYAAGLQIDHGIFRELPLTNSSSKVPFNNFYTILNVTKNGRIEPYHTKSNLQNFKIYIGTKDSFLPKGVYTYQLTYEVESQIHSYSDFDEVYWNVTGNYWVFDIDNVTARVILPKGANAIQTHCYTGILGSKANNCNAKIVGNSVYFTSKNLKAEEGFTVAVGFPKGIVHQPFFLAHFKMEEFLSVEKLAIALLAIFVCFGFYFYSWKKYGEDPLPANENNEFEDLKKHYSPSSIKYLKERYTNTKTLLVSIFSLSIKGAIEINGNGKQNWADGFEYFLKKGTKTNHLAPEENAVLESLFKENNTLAINSKVYKIFKEAQSELQKSLEIRYNTKDYFRANVKQILLGFSLTIAVLLGYCYIAKGTIFGEAIFGFIFLILTVLLIKVIVKSFIRGDFVIALPCLFVLIFPMLATYTLLIANTADKSYSALNALVLLVIISGFTIYLNLIRAYTKLGIKTKSQIEKFKQQLLKYPVEQNADTIRIYEENLPYAFALDIDKEWNLKFTDALKELNYTSNWITTSDGSSGFSYRTLVHFSKTYTTSSSSSSGSSGGGSSGGGGGGGGGGGW
ncbi:DUF2207 domain-containing protein [Flavobacterium collinsii]|uniref:DUF2207 domain-containing protein n=1 Tax=Flavobacterium collinsii TaxID=1114861 RepID=A0ABM8KDU6_9FLAO|nr:DUF2207 domain-containing protein [Flavobacterium collinsii]CAA9195080.1 hypothetical protein FLACOL7796_00429 [Flavobacterium collinsii]